MAPANAAVLYFASSECVPSLLPALAVVSGTPAATMSATKLNPAAAPFPCPYALHIAPPAPPPFPLADACPPRFPLVTYYCGASPHGLLGYCFPVQQSASPVLRKGVPAARLHGLPPHKLMVAFSGPCGGGKRQAAAAVAMKLRQEPAAAAPQVPPPPRKPRTARQKAESRSQAKAPRPRKVAGPRARQAAWRETTPSSLYTTPPQHGMKLKPSELGESTTIMLRNIPNKIRSGDMINLLDEHCSRVNRAAGAVVAAYDVVYLPMDFRKEANFGYAFINFTTSEAATQLYYSLQNHGWNKRYGSKKVIKIDEAKEQGKANLVKRLEGLRLCDDEEFLPVEFSPPRDGVNVPAAPTRIRSRQLAGRPAPRARKATPRRA